MKKLLVVLAVLFIGILLAGCTSPPVTPVATPAPTPVPTPVVTTVAPTPVVTKNVTVVVIIPVVNVTANVTVAPTPVYVISFTKDLTVVPGLTAYVKAGTRVIWQDDDPYWDHSIAAIGAQQGAYFGTGTVAIPHNGNYSVVFDKVGSYEYTSEYQPILTGSIFVS